MHIQGLLLDGREHLPHAAFFWLDFVDIGALGSFLELQLTAAYDDVAQALDVAVTVRLLRRLALPEATLAGSTARF